MNYLESNPQRWYKAQSYHWLRGSILSKGAFSEYDPFKTTADLYQDFLFLMQKVDAYRNAFLVVGKVNARMSTNNRGIIKKNYETAKTEMMEQYITFANRWGMLGSGFSRIIDASHTGYRSRSNGSIYKRDIIHEQGKVKRLTLREADTASDFNLSKLIKKKALKFNRFNTIYPDSLPVSGCSVPLSVWEKDYGSMDMHKYSESLDSLAGCRELLGIWNDINNQDNDREITFHPTAVSVTGESMTWRWGSLIQAIQIIHVLNKTSQLIDSWEICRECISMFRKKDKYLRKFCSDKCRNTAKVRNYRAKRRAQLL